MKKKSNHTKNSNWQKRLQEKFNIQLSLDLINWFDNDMWQNISHGIFVEFVSPETLIDSSSNIIAGGLHLPDTLPIAGNGCGDDLLIRFATDGSIKEIIQWSHEGGSWIPWGKSFSEALLFDSVKSHSDNANAEYYSNEENEWLLEWVLKWAIPEPQRRIEIRQLFDKDISAIVPLLIKLNLCEVACIEFMIENCLSNPLRIKCMEIGGQTICDEIGMKWKEMEIGLKDPSILSEHDRKIIAQYLRISVEELVTMDWSGAASWVEKITALRSDIAWPFLILKKNAEKNNNMALAAKYFESEMKAMQSTYDYPYDWLSYPFPHRQSFQQYEEYLKDSPSIDLIKKKVEQQARNYWIDEAERAERKGDYASAYSCWYAAGWDQYFSNDIPMILERLVKAAHSAGFSSLEKIAEHHLSDALKNMQF